MPIQFSIACMAALAVIVIAGRVSAGKKLAAIDADFEPAQPFPGTVLTIAGKFLDFRPDCTRPGCILELTDGETVGYYYVPLSPHDVRMRYEEGTVVRFRIAQDTKPDCRGVYDTLGCEERDWDIVRAC